MQVKIYCDLCVSECWQEKKEKIIRKLRQNRLQPQVYVIELSQGEQNHLEFFSSILLKQRVYRNSGLFVVGIAAGYDEALTVTTRIADHVYRETGGTDIRRFILDRQKEYEKAGRWSVNNMLTIL